MNTRILIILSFLLLLLARADLLRELRSLNMIPHAQVYQYMSRPVCTVDYGQTIGNAKSLMKKTRTNYLVVTRSENVIGSI